MTIVLTVVLPMAIGAAITWWVAWWYYKRAGDELRGEARRLHSALGAVAYMLEHPEADVEVQRDAEGAVAGLVVKLQGVAAASFSITGDLTVKRQSETEG